MQDRGRLCIAPPYFAPSSRRRRAFTNSARDLACVSSPPALCRCVIPRRRAFTNGARDLACVSSPPALCRCVIPKRRAFTNGARDLARLIATSPVPLRHPEAPCFHQPREGSRARLIATTLCRCVIPKRRAFTTGARDLACSLVVAAPRTDLSPRFTPPLFHRNLFSFCDA